MMSLMRGVTMCRSVKAGSLPPSPQPGPHNHCPRVRARLVRGCKRVESPHFMPPTATRKIIAWCATGERRVFAT